MKCSAHRSLTVVLPYIISKPVMLSGQPRAIWDIASEFHFQVSWACYLCLWVDVYWFWVISKMADCQLYVLFNFLTLCLFWLWVSTPNFGSPLLVSMDRSLFNLNNIRFKMAIWLPYWFFFSFQTLNFSLAMNIHPSPDAAPLSGGISMTSSNGNIL